MCQHATIRLVSCCRWHGPLGGATVKKEGGKAAWHLTPARKSNLCRFRAFPPPPPFQMRTAERALRQPFVTSGADLTGAAVPYMSQSTETLVQHENELLDRAFAGFKLVDVRGEGGGAPTVSAYIPAEVKCQDGWKRSD